MIVPLELEPQRIKPWLHGTRARNENKTETLAEGEEKTGEIKKANTGHKGKRRGEKEEQDEKQEKKGSKNGGPPPNCFGGKGHAQKPYSYPTIVEENRGPLRMRKKQKQ